MRAQSNFIVLLIGIAVLFSGCTIATHYLQSDSKNYPEVPPEQVKVFSEEKIPFKYEVIGSVAVDALGGGDEAKRALQERAGQIGANAVIDVRLTKINSFTVRSGASGTAVRIIESDSLRSEKLGGN
jgi:hypothetical protein